MQPVLEETIYVDFIVCDATGAAADADSLPTAEVFENATDTTVVALTVTKRTGKTGNYRVPIACTAANGFEVGKSYNVIASATVGGIATKAVAARFQLRTTSSDTVYARIGAAGAGLTALGDTRIAHLDADISGRMATYTQPTGFLAASFPTDPADESLIVNATNAIMSRIGVAGAGLTDVALADASITSAKFSVSAPSTGIPSGILEKLQKLCRRLQNKTVKAMTSATAGTIKEYADDGTTVLTTQAITDDGAGNESQGVAT